MSIGERDIQKDEWRARVADRKKQFNDQRFQLRDAKKWDHLALSWAINSSVDKELWFTDFPELAMKMLDEVDISTASKIVKGAHYALWNIELNKIPPRERYTQEVNAPKIFDPVKYLSDCISVYKECGRLVTRSFVHVYGEVVDSGVTPDEFVALSKQSAKSVGRRVAQHVTYTIPDAVSGGIGGQEFVNATSLIYDQIRHKAERKVHTMKEVHGTLLNLVRQGMSIEDATADILETIEHSSKESVYWTIRVLPALYKPEDTDYGKENFLQDITFLEKESSPKAAKWFAYTIQGALSAASTLKYYRKRYQNLAEDEERKVHIQNMLQAEAIFNISQVRVDYKRLLDDHGQQAATMYALGLTYLFSRGTNEADEARALNALPETLNKLKQSVPVKIFRSFLWNFPKLKQPMSKLESLGNSLVEICNIEGQERAMKILAYTAASVQRGATISGFMDPDKPYKNVTNKNKYDDPDVIEEDIFSGTEQLFPDEDYLF